MSRQAGPFLKFCGETPEGWQVSVLVVTNRETAPILKFRTVDGESTVNGKRVYGFQTSIFWTFRLAIPRQDQNQRVTYSVTEENETVSFDFHVPANGEMPAMAYGSCAGFHSAKAAQSYGQKKNERWQHLLAQHQAYAAQATAEKRPFHLLLMGGDQVYADSIWIDRKETSAIVRWNDEGQNVKAKFSSLMEVQVERFYLRLYVERWAQSGPSEAYASIPTLMMWDDHDIFDGWGSYGPELQKCPVHQGIFTIASRYFRLFQQHCVNATEVPGVLATTSADPNHHSFGFSLGPMAIAAPDLRGSRTDTQILGRPHMDELVAWIDGLATQPVKPKHLILMLSLPLMYPSFQMLETALGFMPGTWDLEDDLRDHWTSRPHKEERLRLIHRLLNFARTAQCRITILSGDVHVAALGTITANQLTDNSNVNVINQLISSALVNAPPPATAVFFLNHVASWTEDIDRNIIGEMKTYPGTSTTFIPKRNWLSLQPDSQNRLWANLHAEGEDHPYVKVIHPVS
jgi:hypothetical protein